MDCNQYRCEGGKKGDLRVISPFISGSNPALGTTGARFEEPSDHVEALQQTLQFVLVGVSAKSNTEQMDAAHQVG
jgi:hypothetical protein